MKKGKWSEEEKEYLRNHYLLEPTVQIAKILDRHPRGVQVMGYNLGLKQLTEWVIFDIRNGEEITTKDIAQRYKRVMKRTEYNEMIRRRGIFKPQTAADLYDRVRWDSRGRLWIDDELIRQN